jgi:caffeoyl-CoA O-methyltransferase
MARRDITDPEVEAYSAAHSSPEPAYLADVAAETERRFAARSRMLTGRLEGRFLATLVAMAGARRILEIGTFTGYSALAMAEGMPEDGRIITCELDPEHAEFARSNIAASPFADRIEVRIGPALTTVAELDGPFDFVFIDADKAGYPDYYEAALARLAPNGTIALDNTLWSGRVVDAETTDETTRQMAGLNARIAADERVTAVVVPIRDGLTLVRKRDRSS